MKALHNKKMKTIANPNLQFQGYDIIHFCISGKAWWYSSSLLIKEDVAIFVLGILFMALAAGKK